MAINAAKMLRDPVLRHAYALTLGYLAGLHGEEPDPVMSDVSREYDEGWLMGIDAHDRGVKAPKYLGYHDDSDLPVKRGDVVTIKKGTMIRHRGQVKPAGRTYQVTINHLMNGQNAMVEGNAFRKVVRDIKPPTVVWPGSSGYWSEVDINDIPEAQ